MLEYQVDQNGQIVSVKGFKDEGDYQLVGRTAERWPEKMNLNRWADFKKAVVNQPPNVLIVWGGFRSAAELKRAVGVFGRWKQDKYICSLLNGSELRVASDSLRLELYTMRVTNDNPEAD